MSTSAGRNLQDTCAMATFRADSSNCMSRIIHRGWIAAAAVSICGCAAGRATSQSAGGSIASRPHVSAATIGQLRDSVRALLQTARADSAFPGAFVVVGNRDSIYTQYAVGSLDWAPSATPDENTLWDMASLTKVTGMTSAMMQLT